MSDDTDNVTYLNTKVKKDFDNETLNYFLAGATEHAAYQDAEAFAAACVRGILLALEKKIGLDDDGFSSDIAIICVLMTGLYMRQVGVSCPEIIMLDDIKESLVIKKEDI